MLRLTNRSQFPDFLISRLFHWGREQLAVPVEAVEILRVYNYKRMWRGTAFKHKRQIIARVAATTNGYPRPCHQYSGGPFFNVRDCFDALAYVLFHELSHFKDWAIHPPTRTGALEARVERINHPVYNVFREHRVALFETWGFVPAASLVTPGVQDEKILRELELTSA